MKKCSNCGLVERDDRVRFCTNCGQRLPSESSVNDSSYIDYDAPLRDRSQDDRRSDVEQDYLSNGFDYNQYDRVPQRSSQQAALRQYGARDKEARFCVYCGVEFNEYGICPRCGNRMGGNTQAYRQREPYFDKLIDCVKALFSPLPFNGVENAGRETGNSIWPVCTAFFAIATALGLTNIIIRSIESIFDTIIKAVGNSISSTSSCQGYIDYGIQSMYSNILDAINLNDYFWTIAAIVFVAVLVLFFFSSATLRLLIRNSRDRVSYIQLMNVNSFALLPFSFAGLLAFAISYLSAGLAVLILIIGLLASKVMLYYAIQKLVKLHSSPFWTFIGALTCNAVVITLMYIIIRSIAI